MLKYANDGKDNGFEENYADSVDAEIIDSEKSVKLKDKILLNRPSKVIVVALIATIALPLLLYNFIVSSTLDLPPSDGYSFGSCLIGRETRVPCGRGNISSAACHSQCCYDSANGFCFHRFPSRFSYLMDINWTENVSLYPRIATEPFSQSTSLTGIRLSIDEMSSTHLSFTLYDENTIGAREGKRIGLKNYTYEISSPELGIVINSTQGTILNTMRGPLIAAQDIWEISFKLTNETMHGLGEIPLTAGVKVLYGHRGGLNSLPLIFAKLNGSYHGLLIDIETPTEVIILEDNQIVLRSLTSSQLKFHLFVGPKPKDIMADVTEMLGSNRDLEYWMLGVHICNSYNDLPLEEAYEKLVEFLENAETNDLRYESHCGLSPLLFNYIHNETLISSMDLVKRYNKRFIPQISPYLKHQQNKTLNNETSAVEVNNGTNLFRNLKEDLENYLLQDPFTSEVYVGLANKFNVTYPDFGAETLKGLLIDYFNGSLALDGLILENSWPLDESLKLLNETFRYLPYFSQDLESAFNETPKWNVTYPNGETYFYRHNSYANNFYSTMREIFQNVPISSSSQWMSNKAIVHKQHVRTTWASMKDELVQAALGGISGQRLWSSPICGDTEAYNNETQTDLCIRWYLAATYMPLVRIHSEQIERHPLTFIGSHKVYIEGALDSRLFLLPYFYKVLQNGPLLRPMFYQFPESFVLENITTQFGVGDDLLIVPDLLPGQSHVHVWLPPGTWYELWSGLRINGSEGDPIKLATTEADFLTVIKGGTIIFMQKDLRRTVEETRKSSNYTITIALENAGNSTNNFMATGDLYVNENLTISIVADANELRITSEADDFGPICSDAAIASSVIEEINIYGSKENNNYDTNRRLSVDIDLCRLQNGDIDFVYG